MRKLIDKSVAIIGYGYVGKAVEKYFADHYSIVVYDPPYIKDNDLEGIIEKHDNQRILFTTDTDQVNSCELAIVCVPTPDNEDGSVDLSYIEATFEWLNTPLILLKSTVPPGTTDRLIKGELGGPAGRAISFSPEYIGEGGYEVPYWKGYPHPTNMKLHDFYIFGGEKRVNSEIISFFMRVSGPDARYIQTDSTTAELVKYMFNSWGATKVTFCNEFYNIAHQIGVNYEELRELLLLDGRMERMHTAVFPEKRGFGGKCFPKDVKGIVDFSQKQGYEPTLLKEVLSTNDKIRGEKK